MSAVAKVFEFNPKAVNIPRALVTLGILLLELVVLVATGLEMYWLSVAFASVFVALSDPGGSFAFRVRELATVGLLGAILTAGGFALGTGSWVLVAVVVFVVTLLASVAIAWGVQRYVAAVLLNAWFLVALSVSAGSVGGSGAAHWWQQGVAWLVGSALWILVALVAWLAHRRSIRPSRFPEIPADVTAKKLTRPMLMFSLIRALAVAISVAVAFGLKLPNADWMPVATLVAMKSTVGQAALAATQRLIGAILGAIIATLFVLTVDNKLVLEIVLIVLLAIAGSIRAANYAIYCTAVAAAVLIGIGLSHPSTLSAEWQRVLFTFIGIAIGLIVLMLGNQLAKRQTRLGSSSAASTDSSG